MVIILVIVFSEIFVVFVIALLGNNGKPIEIRGGSEKDDGVYLMPISIEKRVVLDNKPLFIDGNNVVHAILYQKSWPISSFNHALSILADSLKHERRQVNIIIKDTKKSNLNVVKKIASENPKITFHVAHQHDEKVKMDKSEKINKARDDLLTIWLAKDAYIISNDLYRDFSVMNRVPHFKHITIKDKTVREEIIKPDNIHSKIEYFDRPNRANHLRYDLVQKSDAKSDIKNEEKTKANDKETDKAKDKEIDGSPKKEVSCDAADGYLIYHLYV